MTDFAGAVWWSGGGWLILVPMNRVRLGLAILVSGIAYGAYQLFGATSKLQFGKLKLTGKKFTLSGLELDFIFPIVNTDKKTSLPFDGFNGAMVYGTHKLAAINITEKYVLKANSTVNTSVKVVIDYFSLGAEIVNIIKTQDFLNAAYVEGIIKSAGLKFKTKTKI